MFVIVDERQLVTNGYACRFQQEGVASTGFGGEQFIDWVDSAIEGDLRAVEAFLIGECAEREDGRWASSHSVEQFVEFGSRHCFSRFGDTLIASAKGEFDEISDLRADQNRRFLTRRGERNRQASPFDSRQQLERNPHQKLVRGVAIASKIGVLGHECYRVLWPTRSYICNEIS